MNCQIDEHGQLVSMRYDLFEEYTGMPAPDVGYQFNFDGFRYEVTHWFSDMVHVTAVGLPKGE